MDTEKIIRLGAFLIVFLVLMVAEVVAGRRQLTTSKSSRWLTNLTLVALNPLVVMAIVPVLPTGVAVIASKQGWGLLNLLDSPYWLKVLTTVIALDLVVYFQHVLHHAVPLLWRLHMVHHTDLDFDLTTGLRFHPIEIIISMAIKLFAIAALGAPFLAVLIFEIALNATAMFNHSNIHLPERWDRRLRLLLVTPDMHRVHHSVIVRETNSNYGFCFPWWDRLLGTYRAQPTNGHIGMAIGLSWSRDPEKLSLPRLLILPFGCGSGQENP